MSWYSSVVNVSNMNTLSSSIRNFFAFVTIKNIENPINIFFILEKSYLRNSNASLNMSVLKPHNDLKIFYTKNILIGFSCVCFTTSALIELEQHVELPIASSIT